LALADLTPEAGALVRAGRAALQPSDADRERVFNALLPKLGGVEALSASTQTTTASTMLAKAGAVLVGLGVAGAGLVYTLRDEPPKTNAPAVVTATQAPPAPAPVVEATVPVEPAEPKAQPPEKRAPVVTPPADKLAQEVAILSRAGAELHGGRPQAALSLLNEHQAKFPNGALTQERTAARARALCALGRLTEAEAELGRLARTSPNSPHVARARKACSQVQGSKN
jgi:hypothetical protein